MALYRKKPVVIEAVQLPTAEEDCSDELLDFLHAMPQHWYSERGGSLTIQTLEGDMLAKPGDYVIKGVHGEYYPCKPEIFAATYDKVEPPCETAADFHKKVLANLNNLEVLLSESPHHAPIYRQPDFSAAVLCTAHIVKGGTMAGRPTVDLIFEDEHGNKYVAMITGRLLEALGKQIELARSADEASHGLRPLQ